MTLFEYTMPKKITHDYIVDMIDKHIIFKRDITKESSVDKKIEVIHKTFSNNILKSGHFSEFLNIDTFKKYIKERKSFCRKIAKANMGAVGSWERVGSTIKVTSFIGCDFDLHLGEPKSNNSQFFLINDVDLNIYENYTGADKIYAQNVFNLYCICFDIHRGKSRGFILADKSVYAFRGI